MEKLVDDDDSYNQEYDASQKFSDVSYNESDIDENIDSDFRLRVNL